MAGKTRSDAVPDAMVERFEAVASVSDAVCREHLNKEYALLARKALAALARKRPSPLSRGKANTWALGVVYALGQVNGLNYAGASPRRVTAAELCGFFGLSPNTGGSKAAEVRKLLGIEQLGHEWVLPSQLGSRSDVWLVMVDGFIVDARSLSRRMQVEAFEKGLIPYVPCDGNMSEGCREERNRIMAEYDAVRASIRLHFLAVELMLLRDGTLGKIAKRLGLLGEGKEIDVDDKVLFGSLAPAADLAFFKDSDVTQLVSRYVDEEKPSLSDVDRKVLSSLSNGRLSLFRVERRHESAGFWLRDHFDGSEVWLVDRAFEANATIGLEIMTRIFKPTDFWVGAGVVVPCSANFGKAEADGFAKMGEEEQRVAREDLAEQIYRAHFGAAAKR